jgi:Lysyl oxidase
MNTRFPYMFEIALASAIAGIASIPLSASAQVVELRPNLTPLPAFNFSLNTDTSGKSTLRFSTTSWNGGTGPLQIEAGEVDTGNGKQKVYQRVFNSDNTSTTYIAGWVEFHPSHNHFHFNDYALYTLQPVNAPGGSSRTGQKTTFCIMDTTKVLQDAGSSAFTTCGNQIQGMTVGWGDTYGSQLSGQEIDVSGNPDGSYRLAIEVDPKKLILESDDNDNVSNVDVCITKPNTVRVLDSNGTCSVLQAISPIQLKAGTSYWVTLTGAGFTPNMTFSFEGGSGPRPVAGPVQWVSDPDSSVMVYVTVPYKKQLGRDPVWDVRASTGGVLRDAFTVTK